MSLPAVLLHGFAGTGRAWDAVRPGLQGYVPRIVTPDLLGHGGRGTEPVPSIEACVDAVLAAAPPVFVLAGYSMGGRIALHAALAAPQRVAGLVLVAATAGIENTAEREARRLADEKLADVTEAGTIEDFVRRWSEVPLFAGQGAGATDAWVRDMRRNNPVGLAASLRGAGTGTMMPVWDRLGELTMGVRVLVGERDVKFTALGERLASGLPNATLGVVPGAGHAVAREAPAAVAEALRATVADAVLGGDLDLADHALVHDTYIPVGPRCLERDLPAYRAR